MRAALSFCLHYFTWVSGDSTLRMATNFEYPELLSDVDLKYITLIDLLAIGDDTIEAKYPCRICPLVFVKENRNLDRPVGLKLYCMYWDLVFDFAYLRAIHLMLPLPGGCGCCCCCLYDPVTMETTGSRWRTNIIASL